MRLSHGIYILYAICVNYVLFFERHSSEMAIQKSLANAFDMLPHLAKCAKSKTTITYTELGELIGVPAFLLGQSLDFLRDHILPKHNLPRIDALVVNKESQEAGGNFYECGKGNLSEDEFHNLLDWERQKVFEYGRWDEIVPRIQALYGDDEYTKTRKVKPL